MPEPQDIRLSPTPAGDPQPKYMDDGVTDRFDCVTDCTRPVGHYGACIKPVTTCEILIEQRDREGGR